MTAATTELSASAAGDDVSDTSAAGDDVSDTSAADAAPLWPPDELHHSRLHLQHFAPPPCFSFSAAAGLSPMSVLIHFPDASIDRLFSASIRSLCVTFLWNRTVNEHSPSLPRYQTITLRIRGLIEGTLT
jgi:hypothetical protein